LNINSVIFHQLEKKAEEKGPETVSKDYASDLLSPEDPIVQKFCKDIVDSYRTQNPIWGNIDPDKNFHALLEAQNSPSPSDFVTFSKNITDLIKTELSKSIMGTGGFILILNYTHSETDWLMVIMLKNDEGYGLSDLLTLEKRKYLNLKKLNESARINIQQWLDNISLDDDEKGNCLSFMKGKKDEDVTEYFRNALGCVGYQSSNKNTKNVINAITKYMESRSYPAQTRDSIRESMYTYFSSQYCLDLEVDLLTISRKVNAESPEDFTNYLIEENIMIDSSFKPSEKNFKTLQKISFNIGDVKVSFTYDDLNENVILNNDGLLIKSIPRHIVNEIESYKPRITPPPSSE
jgi:nucleoid-associated protein